MATGKTLGFRAAGVALFALAPLAAHAQGWSGAFAGSLSGYNPFSIVGDVLTITAGADSYLTSAGAGLNNNLLLGIRGIWLIDGDGNAINGLTSATGNGVPGFDWAENTGGYTAENGFASDSHWITMQSPAVMSAYGKGSGTGYTGGTFTFAPMPSSYAIGIDYLVADQAPTTPDGTDGTTKTGRIFIGGPNSIPEPGTLALAGIGLAACGLTRRRRR